eukprot:1522837-Prymnesium_polylepis.1
MLLFATAPSRRRSVTLTVSSARRVAHDFFIPTPSSLSVRRALVCVSLALSQNTKGGNGKRKREKTPHASPHKPQSPQSPPAREDRPKIGGDTPFF